MARTILTILTSAITALIVSGGVWAFALHHYGII